MHVREEFKDELSYNIQEQIESYLVDRYSVLDLNTGIEKDEEEEELGVASLTAWTTVELEIKKKRLEIDIEEICEDLSPKLKEYLEQNYTLRQFDMSRVG